VDFINSCEVELTASLPRVAREAAPRGFHRHTLAVIVQDEHGAGGGIGHETGADGAIRSGTAEFGGEPVGELG
jgi:hypothetical protein